MDINLLKEIKLTQNKPTKFQLAIRQCSKDRNQKEYINLVTKSNVGLNIGE